MARQRDGFVPIGDLAIDLPGVTVPARRQPPRSPPSSGAIPGPHDPNQSGNPHQKEIRDQAIE